MDLKNRRAVVTGAASGIGRAMAELLAQRGVRLVLADIDQAAIEAVAATIDGAIAVHCDVADHASVENLAAITTAELSGVDLVFANAGTILNGSLIKTTPEEFDWLMGVNLRGAWSTLTVFARLMVGQDEGGLMCVTGSEHSLGMQHTGAGVYTASKQAILGLAEVLRAEVPEKVGISVFCPGIVATGLADAKRPAHLRQPKDHQRAMSNAVQAMGMSATSVAEAAIAGTLARQPIIVTHPHSILAARARATAIEDAFAEQAPWHDDAARFDVNRIVAQVLARKKEC